MYYMTKRAGGHKLSPSRLPPYKPEEILEMLSGHTFGISKCINLKFWEDI